MDEQSGLLVNSLEKEELSDQFEQFLAREYDRQAIQERARARFSEGQKFWN